MKVFTKLGLMTLFVLVLGCGGKNSCGTRETKVEEYKGKPDMIVAHYGVQLLLPFISMGGCQAGSCDYQVTVRVMLHNPTGQDLNANVECHFVTGAPGEVEDGIGYHLPTRHRKDVLLPAQKKGSSKKGTSRGVEITDIVGAMPGEGLEVYPDCNVQFTPVIP